MSIQTPPHLQISVPFTGTLVITSEVVQQLFRNFQIDSPQTVRSHHVDKLPGPQAGPSQPLDKLSGHPERLAFTIRETAKILGVSYITVYRLMQRRLLRCSNVVRKKLIPKKEIERFLEETLESA